MTKSKKHSKKRTRQGGSWWKIFSRKNKPGMRTAAALKYLAEKQQSVERPPTQTARPPTQTARPPTQTAQYPKASTYKPITQEMQDKEWERLQKIAKKKAPQFAEEEKRRKHIEIARQWKENIRNPTPSFPSTPKGGKKRKSRKRKSRKRKSRKRKGGTKRTLDDMNDELSSAKLLVHRLNQESEELKQSYLALPINQQNDPHEPLTDLIADVTYRLVKAEKALKKVNNNINYTKKVKTLHTMRGGLISRNYLKR